jgi:hypothetical protein
LDGVEEWNMMEEQELKRMWNVNGNEERVWEMSKILIQRTKKGWKKVFDVESEGGSMEE